MKIFLCVLACLTLWSSTAFSAEPTCATVTSTVELNSLKPHSPLERALWATTVCYRKKWLDADSEAKTSSAALAAQRAIPPQIEETPENVLLLALLSFTALALGVGVGHFVWR